MLRKLLEGFLFGVGFSLAFAIAALFVMPERMSISFQSNEPSPFIGEPRISSPPTQKEPGFHEMSLDDQIKKASVIALADYEQSQDGKMKAIIRKFLKKSPDTEIHYKVGDELPSGSFYPAEGRKYGEGVIAFFVGSPASLRLTVTYSGDRIPGLADIPMELFRKKCEAAGE